MEKREPFRTLPAISCDEPPNRSATDARLVTERVWLLLGCYRKGEAADPDVYVSAVATVLSRYSETIVLAVTDPADGLPGQCAWLPTVAEVKAACERLMEPARREAARYRAARDTAVLLTQESVPEDERDRVAAHWQQVRPTLAAPDAAPVPEPFELAVERLRSRAREPVVITTKALQAKLEAMGAEFEPRTFVAGRAANTLFDIPPGESLKQTQEGAE